jgi:hypothetical protein
MQNLERVPCVQGCKRTWSVIWPDIHKALQRAFYVAIDFVSKFGGQLCINFNNPNELLNVPFTFARNSVDLETERILADRLYSFFTF